MMNSHKEKLPEMASQNLRIVKKDDYFPSFSRPSIIGFYSIDERQFVPSSKNLKYLFRPSLNDHLNLDAGFETYLPKPETLENEDKIDSLFHWINHNQYFTVLAQEPEITFVCFRGLLTTIMRTPYENQEDWFISAVKVKNVIFLCSFYTDDKKAKIQAGRTQQEEHFEYWGRKFEQYMLTDDPRRKPDLTKPVNANEEFSLIFRAKLNNNRLIYGAETDGFTGRDLTDPDSQLKNINPAEFVELKTSRIIQSSHQDRNFKKFKSIKWWSQSFMVGIQNIVCGFRDDNGIVRQIQDFRTSDLTRMSKQFWSACVCMRFLDDFLNFVKAIMADESDMSQWGFHWKPDWPHVTAQKMTPSTVYNIIPSWFLNECHSYSNAS